MTELVFRGMKRRRKDIVYVVLVTFIATFFMSGILMFQSILDSYVAEKNRDTYGDWVVACESSGLNHPYLSEKGSLSAAVYLRNEDGSILPKCVGSISPELQGFGRIHLYEGRMPENETEIVSDLQTLQKLGYSYDLGQTITIHWDAADPGKAQDIREKSYTLVGTVKPFNQLWVQQDPLRYPDLIVTEEEMQSFGKEIRTSWFYRLDPELPEIDTREFVNTLQNSLDDVRLIFNSYVYDSNIWGSREGYNTVIGMMIVLSAVSISFVLSAYVDKRRQAYYRLRMIGCPRSKLNGIIFDECSLSTVIPALIALGLAYLAGALICRIIAKSVGLQGFFGFELSVFMLQLAAVFGTILLAILLSMQRTADRRLSQESKALSAKEIARVRKALPKLQMPEKELFRRQRILHPSVRVASFLFTVVATMFLLICLSNVISAVRTYTEMKEEPDYSITIRNPKEIIRKYSYAAEDGSTPNVKRKLVVKYNREYVSPYYGPTDQELQYLRSTDGISDIRGFIWDDWHLARWEGIEDSPRQRHMGGTTMVGSVEYTAQVNELFTSVNIVYDINFLKEYFKELDVSFSEADYEAFMRGEFCFVIGNIGNMSPAGTGVSDETLRDGDMLTIFSENNEEGLQIPVRILENDAMVKYDFVTVNRGYLPLFVSQLTADRLRHLEDPVPEFRENRFLFRFNSFSSFEATDKVLASFVSDKKYSEYENHAESKRLKMHQYVLRPLFIFGSLFLMTIAVFFIVQRNFAEIRCRGNLESLRRFRRIGMRRRELRKNLFLSEVFEADAVLAGIAASIIRNTISSFFAFRKELSGDGESAYWSYSNLSRTWTQNPYLMAVDRLLSVNTLVTVLEGLVLFVILSLFGYHISCKMYESEEVL